VTESLYERYKDALRRGHVAAMHGRPEAALAAYVEAATIAPDRALPHSSIGSAYLRLGRPRDALSAFDAALARAPSDEAVLAGRASALEALGRRAAAATALDALVAVQESDGRLADACDTARRALELAESRARRRAVEGLVARLRDSAPEGPGAEALARAVGLLEATGVAERAAMTEPGPAATGAGPASGDVPVEPAAPPIPSLEEALELADRAEGALAGHDLVAARRLLLEAADAHARGGRSDAALDACDAAVAIAPADPALHLALARLYLDRGWRSLASDKLVLLDRLAELAGDEPTREAVRRIASERLAGEPYPVSPLSAVG
jgi:tetratricopeptide (TPR) repeat protein